MPMRKNNNKKEITLEDLIAIMQAGFANSEKATDKKIDDLAIMAQNGFNELRTEFKVDLKAVEEKVDDVKDEISEVKAELNKKVDKFEHNGLEYRVEKLEKKFA